MNKPPCRLYLISPPDIGGDATAAFSDAVASALDGGDVACLQLRLKDVDDDVIRRSTQILLPVVQERDVALIMNDRPDLAVETGCDGVHVGQDDAAYEDARKAVGDDAIVGVTCHDSIHLAISAAEANADYVAFGAFFESNTKQRKFAADPDILTRWQDMTTVPCVAIGGITVENCRPIVEAGADFIAVAGGVWAHPDGPAAAVKAFNKIFEEVAAG
ncbi:MAG: thiamine phosphate synthase [Rhodospirillaceae bacterium]|jgi:thiamine-phosphate pyrophosphorylase|nr:thiamine phosphate synthase [Rhodospirillaceae bacterium]MBT5455989.1 thiamine phosphate synthase [Rhodospirillaceae bacterium]